MTTDPDDYLTPILRISNLKESNEITVITRSIAKSMQLFSLYGTDIDEFYSKFLEYRAIDQKHTADIIVKAIFQHILKPNIKMNFNFIYYKKLEIDIDIEQILTEEKQATHLEIDVAIEMNVYPKDLETDADIIEDEFCFLE